MEPGRGFHKAASLPRRLVGRDLARRSMVLLEMKLHSVVLALFVSLVVTGCGHHKHHREDGEKQRRHAGQREHKRDRDHKRESLTGKVIRYPFRMTGYAIAGAVPSVQSRAEGGGRAPGWFRKRRLSQLSGRCSATVKIVVIRSTATVIAKRVRRAGASKRREMIPTPKSRAKEWEK